MNRYEITAQNITEVTTEELASFFYPTKADISHAADCLKGALQMDISEWKRDNARKNYEQDKARFNLILNELKSRGVKTVKRSGEYA